MNILDCFVENLKDLMFDNQMSTKDLSNNLNLTLSQCQRYLRKANLPTFSTIVKIADYFNCSIDYMLGLAPYLIDDKLNYTPPFNETFTQILTNRGITRYQIHKALHISTYALSNWYHGERTPTIDSVMRLAEYFDCTIDTLLGRDYRK